MATTIITKNGSGAPVAGNLTEGELALDLTNKKLYSKEGSTVFEVGATGGGASGTFTDLTATSSFTSPGIDDNANATAITIDSGENVGVGETSPAARIHSKTSAQTLALLETTNSTRGVLFLKDANTTGNTHVGIGALGNDLQLFSGGSTARVTIDSAGLVGIGTTAPAGKLHTTLATSHTWGSAWSAGTAVFGGAGSTSGAFGISYNDTDGATLGAIAPGVAWKPVDLIGSELRFSIANVEKMRIDAAGNLGIGTGSGAVAAPLHVDGSSSTGVAGYLRLQNDTSNTGYTGVYFSVDPTYAKQAIYAQRAAPNGGGSLIFAVDSNTDAADVAISDEKMRLDASGNLLVGATGAIGGAAASRLQVTHTTAQNGLTIKNAGNARYYIHAVETSTGDYALLNDAGVGVRLANGASAWSAFSDETLKENIRDIGPVLDTIKDFQCVNYSLKVTESEAADKVGFIAQDWENTFPNVVAKDEEGTLSIKYTETIPVLLKAIQEQQTMIEELKAEVAALKGAN